MTDVTVVQDDRDAAAAYYYSAGGAPTIARQIREGQKDNWFRVQAFARHRLAALADAQGEAVQVGWQYKRKGFEPALSSRQQTYADLEWQRPLYTHPPAQDVEALVEENKRLQQALVDHNDRLRSAQSIAFRDGAETNWLTFRGTVTYTLAEHHETVVAAREALASFRSKP